MSAGRRKDLIWQDFLEIKNSDGKIRAKCKTCEHEIAGLVARMKQHKESKCTKKGRISVQHGNVDVVDVDDPQPQSDNCASTSVLQETASSSSLSTVSQTSQLLPSPSYFNSSAFEGKGNFL